MAEIGIRNYLNNKGFKDDEITYNNGNVMLKGKQFYGATPQADSKTYGDPTKLDQAFNAYNNQSYQDDARNVLSQVQQRINTPAPQFNYNRATDPLYQDAIKSAQQNAQTAGNNATVRLGARGIGNSQQALTTENQIQQRELGQVERDIAPQLYNQAYQKYMGEYAMGQDQLKNQMGLFNTYNNMYQQGKDEEQRGLDNDYRTGQAAEQKKQNNWDAYLQSVANTGDLGTGAKEDYNLLGTRSGNLSTQGQQLRDNQAQQTFENKLKEDLQRAQLANMATDNELARARESRIASGETAEAKKATAEEKKVQAAKIKKMDDEKQALYGFLTDPEQPLQYSEAKKEIQDNLRVGFYTQEEADELLNFLDKWANSAYATRYQ